MNEPSTYAIGQNAKIEVAGAAVDWPNLLAFGLFFILGALIVATFQDYGISWDEMLQNTYGRKLLDYYTSGFSDRSAFDYSNLFLYGGFFDVMAALVNTFSPFGEYETRHLLGGLMFLIGLIGAWRLAKLLAGSRAALITLVCLATTPLLYGHGFINPKDSPLAWLLIWVLYFGCRILQRPGRASTTIIVGFGLSLGLALGTRVIALAFPAYLAALLSLAIWFEAAEGGRVRVTVHQAWQTARPLVLALPLTVAVMALFWPWSVQAPLNVFNAFETFSHFTWHPVVLWGGELVRSTQLPAVYLTRLLLFQLPEYVILGVVLITLFGLRALRRDRIRAFATASGRQYLFVAMAILVPIAAFMVIRPVAYNGVRHFLFIVPPLVVLAGIGLDKALVVAARKRRHFATVLWAVLLFGFAWQAVLMANLHPYQYLSYNALTGGIAGAQKRFELDYWGTSLAEASRGLAAFVAKNHVLDGGVKAKVFVCGDRMSAAYFLPPALEVTDRLGEADFYVGINDPPCRDHFDNPQEAIFQVQRQGVTLSYVRDIRTPEKAATPD